MATPMKLSLTSRDTALCIIPPRSQWSKVDQLRSRYDRAYGKWPPHVNVLYPFIQIDALPRAAEAVQSAAAQQGHKPFDVCLDSAGVFQHKRDNTIYIHDGDASQLSNLRAAVLQALEQPEAGEYRMHMTVGQSEDSKSVCDSLLQNNLLWSMRPTSTDISNLASHNSLQDDQTTR
jgi:2'-5' RNA ligase